MAGRHRTEDLELIRRDGVDLVTVGVFARAQVEPQPGVWRFEFFDQVLDGLGSAGVRVSLATMTKALMRPPRHE